MSPSLSTTPSGYPVRLDVTYENSRITVSVVGTKLDDTYVKMTYSVLGDTPYETEYVETEDLDWGTEQQKQSPSRPPAGGLALRPRSHNHPPGEPWVLREEYILRFRHWSRDRSCRHAFEPVGGKRPYPRVYTGTDGDT